MKKYVVRWTEVSTEKYEVSCTADELAELLCCEVDELDDELARPWNLDLAERLADWQDRDNPTLADFQREDITVEEE